MPLEFQIDSVEGLDPAIAGLYTKQETGKHVLTGIENIVPKSKLTEFRNNNTALLSKLEAYKDIDIDAVKTMESELAEAKIRLEQKGELDDDTINKLVESRVDGIKSSALAAQQKSDGIINTQNRQLEELVINGSVDSAAVENKVLSTALTDVKLRAKSVFKMVEGKPVAMDVAGNKMYGDDGVTELSIGSWVKGLVKTSPHLFEGSVTGGLRDGDGAFIGDRSKMTPQQKIQAGVSNL